MASSAISEVLKYLMYKKNLRTTQLAREVALPQQTVHRIVTGSSPHPHQSSLKPLADYFGITVAQLKGEEHLPELAGPPNEALGVGWREVYVLHWGQITPWLNKKIEITELETAFTDMQISDKAFALVMHDSAMEPVFPPGTLLIVDPKRQYKDRDFVIAHLNEPGHAVLRQLLIDGSNFYLKPLSPDFKQFQMQRMQHADRIFGVVVQVKRDLT